MGFLRRCVYGAAIGDAMGVFLVAFSVAVALISLAYIGLSILAS